MAEGSYYYSSWKTLKKPVICVLENAEGHTCLDVDGRQGNTYNVVSSMKAWGERNVNSNTMRWEVEHTPNKTLTFKNMYTNQYLGSVNGQNGERLITMDYEYEWKHARTSPVAPDASIFESVYHPGAVINLNSTGHPANTQEWTIADTWDSRTSNFYWACASWYVKSIYALEPPDEELESLKQRASNAENAQQAAESREREVVGRENAANKRATDAEQKLGEEQKKTSSAQSQAQINSKMSMAAQRARNEAQLENKKLKEELEVERKAKSDAQSQAQINSKMSMAAQRERNDAQLENKKLKEQLETERKAKADVQSNGQESAQRAEAAERKANDREKSLKAATAATEAVQKKADELSSENDKLKEKLKTLIAKNVDQQKVIDAAQGKSDQKDLAQKVNELESRAKDMKKDLQESRMMAATTAAGNKKLEEQLRHMKEDLARKQEQSDTHQGATQDRQPTPSTTGLSHAACRSVNYKDAYVHSNTSFDLTDHNPNKGLLQMPSGQNFLHLKRLAKVVKHEGPGV